MRSLLVTGSDTGVGKTHVVGQIAAALARSGAAVQIVKVIETGVTPGQPGDAETAAASWTRRPAASEGSIEPVTLFKYRAPLAPPTAAALEGQVIQFGAVVAACRALPAATVRLYEGAGGIATPLDAEGHDWADLAAALGIESLVIVIPDRLGAINQSRLCLARAAACGLKATIWLNTLQEIPPEVARSTRDTLRALNIPLLAESDLAQDSLAPFATFAPVSPAAKLAVRDSLAPFTSSAATLSVAADSLAPFAPSIPASADQDSLVPLSPSVGNESRLPLTLESGLARDSLAPFTPCDPEQGPVRDSLAPFVSSAKPASGDSLAPFERDRCGAEAFQVRVRKDLDDREKHSLLRRTEVSGLESGMLNLADNDYLDLSRDPALAEASASAARALGTSAAASPLITGWKAPHERLTQALCEWLGFPFGLLWTSGYAANGAVLGTLPQKGDLILADRLIHASMIAGITRSGARFKRYPHLDLDRLEAELRAVPPGSGTVFVATETIFSMDGDYPDLRRLARLKRDYRFILIVDEAHGLGWYGPTGSGLVAECGIAEDVDVLVGTLGKTLGSGGAFTLFRNKDLRDYLVNHAGEFIYSTALPPPAAAAALAAIGRVRELAAGQRAWREQSSRFRAQLRAAGWNAPAGDSPIVPVPLGDEAAALAAARALRDRGILAAAVRPPTVPAGTSRLRFSLKRTFDAAAAKRVLDALDGVRPRRLRCAWVLGWAVPPDWFAGLVSGVFPEAEHHLIAANAAFRAELERVGPCDLIAGYSLGSFLLLGAANDGWTPAAGTVALLAPIWRFPDRAGLRALRRQLASDPAAALAGFYRNAGLPDAAQFPPPPPEDLAWGLDQLERPGWDVRLPAGWRALVGSGDRLLKETSLKELVPELQVVSGDHHPKPLLEALKRTLAAGGLPRLPNEAAL